MDPSTEKSQRTYTEELMIVIKFWRRDKGLHSVFKGLIGALKFRRKNIIWEGKWSLSNLQISHSFYLICHYIYSGYIGALGKKEASSTLAPIRQLLLRYACSLTKPIWYIYCGLFVLQILLLRRGVSDLKYILNELCYFRDTR